MDKYSDKAYPLFCRLYDDLRDSNTIIGQKVYKLLDEEQFDVVMISDNEWCFETLRFGKLPDYAYEYLKKYIPREYGLKYVFDYNR